MSRTVVIPRKNTLNLFAQYGRHWKMSDFIQRLNLRNETFYVHQDMEREEIAKLFIICAVKPPALAVGI